jgi:hypothetical protein
LKNEIFLVLIGRGVHRIVTTIKKRNSQIIHQAQGIKLLYDVLQGLKTGAFSSGCC